MKIIKIAIIASLVFSSSAFAGSTASDNASEVKANIFSHNDDLVFVQLENTAKSKLRIIIKDQSGKILHSETVKEDAKVLKRYDISNLPSGLYSYKVSTDDYTVIKKIAKK